MGMTTRSYSPEPDDFKDKMHRWRTKSLFIETNADEVKYPSIFTLADDDKDGRVSMKRVYLKANDPTEYKAAKTIFGSYECWENLCKAPFFKPHLEEWRRELQIKIKSEAVATIGDISAGGKATAAQLGAAKWLATQDWDGNKAAKGQRGRPLKTRDPEEALREGLLNAEEDDEDYKRLFKAGSDTPESGS